MFTTDFKVMLDCFDLTQHVNFTSHAKVHILDLICSSGITCYNITYAELSISDHKAVLFNAYRSVHHSISFQNMIHVNPEDLINYLKTWSNALTPTMTFHLILSPAHQLKTLGQCPKQMLCDHTLHYKKFTGYSVGATRVYYLPPPSWQHLISLSIFFFQSY